MAIAALTIDLNARLANIERDLGRAAQVAERQSERMQASFKRAGAAAASIGAALGIGSFAGFVKSSIDAADNIAKLSQKIGVGVEQLAGYQIAADLSGVSLEQFGVAANQLNKHLADQNPLLKRLGITATDADGALAQLADVFARTPDGAQKSAIAMQLMGKSGADMIPLLNGGGAALQGMIEQGKLLNPITEEMAKQAEKFNDALTVFKARSSAAGVSIATELLPSMNNMLARLNDAIKLSQQHGGFISLIFGGINPIGDNAANLKEINSQIDNMRKQLSFVPQGADTSKFDAELTRLQRIKETLQEIQRAQALALNDKYGTAKYKQFDSPVQLADLISPKFGDDLEKALDTKILDKFGTKFGDMRAKIAAEYAALKQTFGDTSGTPTTGSDIQGRIVAARSAFANNDSVAAQAAIDAAKGGLKTLAGKGAPAFELNYLADQLKVLELQTVQISEDVAQQTRDALAKSFSDINTQIDSIKKPELVIDTDLLTRQIQRAVEDARAQLAANPLIVPVIAAPTAGAGGLAVNIQRAAQKLGAR